MSHERKRNARVAGAASGGLVLVLAGLVVVLTATVQAASGTVAQVKPVIGKPVAAPAQPLAGKRMTVSFKVTRSDTGAPLMRGRMICDPSVAGNVLRHAESFKGGVARLSFVVPANAAGKLLKVKVTIQAGGRSATRVAPFRVKAEPTPSLSIGDASIAEGNGGTTTLSFQVTLSAASAKAVSVGFATANGTATAPADFAAASGTLSFKPGETTRAIQVGVVGDLDIEAEETFTVSVSNPVNATIARATATGRITNDDTAVPVTPGNWKGSTTEGNYVFFTVLPNRAVTNLRINALPCLCDPGGRLDGAPDFGDTVFPIGADGRFAAEDTWTGSDVVGDIEWTYEFVKLTGQFGTATSAAGTIVFTFELNYEGTHFRCSSGEVRWSATLQ